MFHSGYYAVRYLEYRTQVVQQHFPKAVGVDNFMFKVEVALAGYGFTQENTIAMTNVCRDEVTKPLREKVEGIFGNSFTTSGLGGVLTLGTIGMKAGMSHSPISEGSGKERYVFFSFPHIAIDAEGEVGAISRPGRPGASTACGALLGCLGNLKDKGAAEIPTCQHTHHELNPEFSILQSKLARRIQEDAVDEGALDLVQLTKIAEASISDDLEQLIELTTADTKADYAVVTGVQIHSWGKDFYDDAPNLEFVAPQRVYVVCNGERTDIDLGNLPDPTPRQLRLLAQAQAGAAAGEAGVPVDPVDTGSGGAPGIEGEVMLASKWPAWQSGIKKGSVPAAAGNGNDEGGRVKRKKVLGLF